MHQNFFFLKQVAQELHQRIVGLEIAECFSQRRDELVIGLCSSQEEFWVKAVLYHQVNTLSFPDEFQRAKQNTATLFKGMMGGKVLAVRSFENERAIGWTLEQGMTLVFKLFGNRSNIILFEGDEVGELFRKNHEQDEHRKLSELDRPILWNREVLEQKGLNALPTLGKEIQLWLLAKGWAGMDKEAQWQEVASLLHYLEHPRYFIVEDSTGLPQLTLLPTDQAISTPQTALLACNDFFYRYAKIFYLEQERQEALRNLQRKLKGALGYKTKSSTKLQELQHGSRFEEIANIIMANLHQIETRSEKVKLDDFYTGNTLEIKLNTLLSPQKNAENYYRKAKNQKLEIENLSSNILEKEEEIDDLEDHIQNISAFSSLKDLRKYLKNNALDNESATAAPFPFRRFEYEGFDILVGKNAKNNDLLTQRYAFKEDLWMHARDVAGSHVVVKYQAGKPFPKTVIEKAAALAAYYSQRRTDTLCPVIYTPKKYVRKPKGLMPGMVVIDKEDVLMIEPKAF